MRSRPGPGPPPGTPLCWPPRACHEYSQKPTSLAPCGAHHWKPELLTARDDGQLPASLERSNAQPGPRSVADKHEYTKPRGRLPAVSDGELHRFPHARLAGCPAHTARPPGMSGVSRIFSRVLNIVVPLEIKRNSMP
jgi:hypothetical protein